MSLQSKTIPNLIQGVSQQSPQQRRDSQCEAQFDCLNSPKDGAVSRHGADVIKVHADLDLTNAFFYELFRGDNEHYLIAIKDGVVRPFNLSTGEICAVSSTLSSAYLVSDGGNAQDSFCAQTIDDYTFIANKHVPPAMAPTLSPTRPKEALVFFRAAGYSETFHIALIWSGNVYTWSYLTPDNSTSRNAQYIQTAQIAATFYRAMTDNDPPNNGYGVGGGVYDGDTGGAGGGANNAQLSAVTKPAQTLAQLGFNISINGNLLRIWRSDGQDFGIDSSDGGGGEHITILKDNARSFSELPKGGFANFMVRVKGSKGEDAYDYFVEYKQQRASEGYWTERVAPGIKTTLDHTTMPVTIINTGLNTFHIQEQTWSKRIAGDGVYTARDPGFVGKHIQNLFFHQGRLAILTESTCDWSKARNVYTFFPDTAQAVLDDAPIGITLSAADTIALLRRAVSIDESLYLWAQRAQFRVHSGQEPFRQDTVEAPPTTAYEFSERANFAKASSALYFATEPDLYATVRSLQFQQGRVAGEADITEHVSEYIPAGVRKLSVSDTGQMLFAQTSGAPSNLYLYNYLVKGNSVVQSAWNTWRFATAGNILWSSVYKMHLFMAVQRGANLVFLKVPLNPRAVDPGGLYRTRLDMRVSEAQCTVSYDATTKRSTIVLPYAIPEVYGPVADLKVVIRTSGVHPRGYDAPVVGRNGSSTGLVVEGDLRAQQFYVGYVIRSVRQESPFFLRGEEGVIPTDRLQVREFTVQHARTGYYRIEVDQGLGRKKTSEFNTLKMGGGQLTLGHPPPLRSGSLKAVVDNGNLETTIKLINDSFLPSAWQSAAVTFEAKLRAKPAKIK